MVQAQRVSFTWGWIVLVVSLVGHGIVVGMLTYAYPVIFPAMVTAQGWSRGDASAALTVGSWVGIVAYPLTGMAISKFGGRRVVTFGAIGTGVVWLLLSQVSELWHWYAIRAFGWALLAPFASTAAFTAVVVQWFNLRRGVAVGTVFLGYSAFGFFAGPITQSIMQSSKSWQMGWAAVGGLILFAGLLCAFLLRSRPSDVGTYADGLSPEEAKRQREAALSGHGGVGGVASTFRATRDWNLREAIRTRQFWCILAVFAGFSGGAFAFSQVGFIAVAKGLQPMDVAFAMSLSALAALPWRFIAGWLTDRIEARWVLLAGQILALAGLVFLWTLPQGNALWLYAWAFLNGTGSAGLSNTLLSVITSNYYGAKNFPTIFASGIMPIGALFTGLAPGLSGYVYDWTKTYDLAFLFFAAILVIAGLAQLINTPPKVKEESPRPAGVA